MEPGVPRREYEALIEALAGRSLRELGREVSAAAAARGVTFGEDGDAFLIDPVPRVLTAEAWSELEAGLIQRVRALDAFVTDVYGARRIVAEGVVPGYVVESAAYYEPALAGSAPVRPVAVAGLDVVRDHEGRFRVLEDNVRTPSGIAYAVAARELMRARLPEPAEGVRGIDDAFALLSAALHAAAPEGRRRDAGARGPQRRAREHRVVGALRDRGAAEGAARRAGRPRRRRRRALRTGRRAPAARRRRLPAHERGPPDRVRWAPDERRLGPARAWRRGRSGWSTASAPAWPTTSSPTHMWRTWSASTSGRSRSCAPCIPTTSPTPRSSRRCSGASTSW